MSNQITTNKLTISEVFENWYCIPSYQRAYVWERDQVIDLLDDINSACDKDKNSEYFLGSLVLQEKKVDNYKEFDVLDGQQRLTTLFLIMAVIRDLATDKDLKNTCKNIIFQEHNKFKRIPERLRLVFNIREDVKDFVDEHIKSENGTQSKNLIDYTVDKKCSLSVINMVNAISYIKEYFQDKNIDDFSEFLINNVVIIYVSTENLDDAFKLFTVLNNRGIKLRSADILKADNLSLISDTKISDKYAENWEEVENYFGENFDEFLSHLQRIITKEKARLNLLEEFEKNIFKEKKLNKGQGFFDFVKKYKNHYEYLFDDNQDIQLNNIIKLMQKGFVSDLWIAPLLKYYDKFGKNNLVDFAKKLNNKFASDWIANLTPTSRIYNMNDIISQIEKIENSSELLNHECLKIDNNSILHFINGDIYGKRQARYILLLANYLYLDEKTEFVIPDTIISVEHILPQNPSENSQWRQDFDDESREQWTNKIGNLIIITRKKNSAQSNKDFVQKKEKYFKANVELGRSVYVMSKQSWTLSDLIDNHKEVLKKLKDNYDIKE
ncbi:DUF262 domain-containing protein [Moraxella bovoculi]|uniref:DUF262 domain-containing protein n=1 Tax=Moraxella bovoculi TaxID=386891 RepID=UPI00072F55D3|nr:DUF262 domain-containing protein [Moraxella bovoculi]AKG15754.2 hypothetical protein AAX08_07385 [Moraxella bovoculi]